MGELSTVVQALQTEHLATVKRQDRHLRCHNKQGPVPQGWGVKWAWWYRGVGCWGFMFGARGQAIPATNNAHLGVLVGKAGKQVKQVLHRGGVG